MRNKLMMNCACVQVTLFSILISIQLWVYDIGWFFVFLPLLAPVLFAIFMMFVGLFVIIQHDLWQGAVDLFREKDGT